MTLSRVTRNKFRRNTDLQKKLFFATQGKAPTQATATKALNDFFYCCFSRGTQYLDIGWRETSQDIGKRRCHFPVGLPYQVNYLRKHLLGDPYGIVKDDATTGVPYIPVDLDRHDPNIDPGVHMEKCLGIGRYLQTISPLHWAVEINPLDGSTKFFGFLKSGNIIPWIQAGMFGESIRQQLVSQGLCHGNNIEVFPFNSKAVFLPMRPDKFTICGKGFLPRANATVQEKHAINKWGDTVIQRYKVRTYSALAFLDWLQSDEHYSEAHLERALHRACHHVPKVQEAANEFTLFLKHRQQVSITTGKPIPFTEEELDRLTNQFQSMKDRETSAPAAQVADKGSLPATQIDVPLAVATPVKAKSKGYRNEADAFLRNHDDYKPFIRAFYKRNKRVPADHEWEHHVKTSKLYSGDWSDRTKERSTRLREVARWTQRTFDPSRLGGNGHVNFDMNYRRLATKLFPNGITYTKERINGVEMKVEKQIVHVPVEFLETLLPIIAFCLKNPNEDNSVPTNRIKELWRLFPDAASWNQKRFSAARDCLHKAGFIQIFDRKYRAQKAMKWRMGRDFPGQKRRKAFKTLETAPICLQEQLVLPGRFQPTTVIPSNRYNSLYHSPTSKPNPGTRLPNWEASRGPPTTAAAALSQGNRRTRPKAKPFAIAQGSRCAEAPQWAKQEAAMKQIQFLGRNTSYSMS